MKIVNFGSLNIDHVYQLDHFVRPGETTSSNTYQKHTGGKGLNQSVALARAGAKVLHAGRIGSDGGFLPEYLQREGIDTSLVLSDAEAPTGHAVIQVNASGENCIIVEGGANRKIDSEQIATVITALEAGDYLLLQNEISSLADTIAAASQRGVSIALNPAPITKEISELPLELIDILFLNEIEGAELSGHSDPQKTINSLLEAYPQLQIVLTLGKQGAIYANSKEQVQQTAYSVKAIDTTAAGDTFIGFFLAAVSSSIGVKQALELACRAASICVTRPGAADSIPSKEELR